MKIQTSFVQDGKWWVTWTDDIPALTQGATLEEARENLREEFTGGGTQGHPLAGRSSRHRLSRGEEFVFLSPLIQLISV
jgi:hypothetical protein